MPQVHVAIGVIADSGRILLTRRLKGDRFEHCWEFPGGKLEPGEIAEQALHRELREELSVQVRIVHPLEAITHNYGDFTVHLHPFVVSIEAGTPRPLAARELRWTHLSELPHVSFPEANTPLLRALPSLLARLNLA